ncbi:hypothetical protein NDR87_14325 [Nocardia sp. CDC159]|uniref:Uncharacterized protein n=1 Tax=Nocardia pulmonis TaxID=2951408 RepID=A0A9X2EA90_9NOCA|nr:MULTISPECIES: hypothetical protein [Nocardia]MCM6774403.1 hypothetical protein [Nocardia pulmonis]MCM6787531.1 hypothetical protein [Nocardia sp. CDC159]
MNKMDEILVKIANADDPEVRFELGRQALGWNMDPIVVQKAGQFTDEEMTALIEAAESERREREYGKALREWAEKARREGGYYPKERG